MIESEAKSRIIIRIPKSTKKWLLLLCCIVGVILIMRGYNAYKRIHQPAMYESIQPQPTVFVTPTALQIAEERKKIQDQAWENAIVVSYDDLFRKNAQYTNRIVKFTGSIDQVIPTDSSQHAYRIAVTPKGSYYTDEIFGLYETDERFLEDDIVEFVARVQGTQTYTAVSGATIEIPRLGIIDMKLLKKAGDR